MKLNVVLVLLGVGILAGCRQDVGPDPDLALDDRASVYLRINQLGEGQPFQLGTTYTDDSGNVYNFDRANIYLSQISLGGQVIKDAILTQPDESEYYLGQMDAGHYHMLGFNIGVDSMTNHADPAQYELGHALGPQTPSQHWSWADGYLFITIGGDFDSDGDQVMDQSWVVHIGLDSLLRNKSFEVHQDLEEKSTVYIDLDLDWDALLTGIDLTQDNLSHTFNNTGLAIQVADNAVDAITHD